MIIDSFLPDLLPASRGGLLCGSIVGTQRVCSCQGVLPGVRQLINHSEVNMSLGDAVLGESTHLPLSPKDSAGSYILKLKPLVAD